MNLFVNWVAQKGFLPHGYCFQWSNDLLMMSVISNAVIALAYYSIPISLLFFLDRNRKDVQTGWVFILFASFIFLCGTTHVVDIITIWYPAYYIQVWVLMATALVSFATACLIWPLVTRASNILGIRMQTLQEENAALRAEVARLKNESNTAEAK